MSTLKLLLSASFLVAAIAGCSVQLPAAPKTAAPAASTPAKSGTTTDASANAAAGTQLAGSAGPVDAADNPIGTDAKKPAPQGIAIGEPNPSAPTGGRVIGTTAILTPCRKEFMNLDANGDGWIDTMEWNHAGKADADFKAKDKDANGQLDNGEYGCQDSAPGGVAPTGKG